MAGPKYSLDEVVRQTSALPDDLVALSPVAEAGAARVCEFFGAVERIMLLGSGDSLHAGLVARPEFLRAGVDCQVMSGSAFLAEPVRRERATAVVGISASGGNPTLVTALTAARQGGCPTAAVTGVADSPLAGAAELSIVVDPEGRAPSPGIRTYQASVLALLHLAGAVARSDGLGERFGWLGEPEVIAAGQRRVIAAAHELAPAAARLLAPVPVVLVVAEAELAGPAAHLAAKLTETAGVPAVAVEREDWWHVHRFGRAPGQPIVAFGTSAVEPLTHDATRYRRVIMVGGKEVDEAVVLPWTDDGIPQAARTLASAAVAGPIAVELAKVLGRSPFGG